MLARPVSRAAGEARARRPAIAERRPPPTRGTGCVLGLSSALAAALAPEVALAAGEDPLASVTLSYVAPEGCGSEDRVMAELREALGSPTETFPEVRVTVVVTPQDARYLLTFRAQEAEAVVARTLVVDSCAAASEVSTLLLLLTLDPVLAESLGAARAVEQAEHPVEEPAPAAAPRTTVEAPAPPGPPPTRPLPAPTPPQTRPPPAPEPRSRQHAWLDGAWVAVGGTRLTAVTPRPGYGASLEGGVRRAPLRLSLGLAGARAQTADIEGVPGARLHATDLRSHLTVALELGRPWLRFGPCADLGVELVTADPEGISAGHSGSTPLVSAAAGGWIGAALTRHWGVLGRATALFPLERPRFWVGGLDVPVFQPSAVGSALFLGAFFAWDSQS